MSRALSRLASAGITILVVGIIIGVVFDWNVVAAWNWFWGSVTWLFNAFVEFFMNSEIFRGIFT